MSMDPKNNPASFPACDLVSDPAQLRSHRLDGIEPKALVFPRQREEVARILAQADAAGQKVLPCGSGTKLSIGRPPERMDLVLQMELLNRVADHDYRNMTVTVEAGARLSAVQATLRERSQFLPLDPPFGEAATIGGILAANSSGPRRLLYGSLRDFALGLTAALPNGSIIKMGGKTVKNVAGFDLTKLFIGSFGTLGVILDATLRVLPLPEASSTHVLLFPDLDAPYAVVSKILGSALAPSAVEVLNPEAVRRVSSALQSAPGDRKPWGLAIACEGFSEAVERTSKDVAAMASGAASVILLKGKEQNLFWQLVTDHLPGSNVPPSAPALRARISVPICHVQAIIAEVEKLLEEARVPGATVAHAGTGIVYFMTFGSPLPAGRILALRKRINELGGWLNLESAPLALKRSVGVWDAPPGGLEIMSRIRSSFDPKRTLNPGRFLEGL